MHPGDPAQTFEITPAGPQPDGSWHTAGTLRLTFSRPVRNPRLHLSGLAATATGKSGTTGTETRLSLTDGSPAVPALVGRTDWTGWTVDGSTLAPAGRDGTSDGAPGSAAEGSLELAGTVRTAAFRVEQRSTARAGSTTAPPVLRQAYTVTVDEGVGTAPQAYGNASHVVSDLFLGADATNPTRRAGERSAGAAGDEPLVRLDHGASLRSPFAGPPPRLQPGRGEYPGADPSISFPAEAAIGRYYRLTVLVEVGDQPATLAGWIDFGHTGRFEPAERVQTEVQPGADTATLEWTVPSGAASGETWARLRIARDTSQLVSSGGFADSGQVSDQRIKLTVGAARPEIAEPVDGTVLADARPEISGDGAVAGATVEVREGDTALCRAKVGRGGDWSCHPAAALAAGTHGLTPVETTSGGVVLRGEPVKVAVKTAPPNAPALTLPAYTNDPELQLTGTGDAGSTVSVTDRTAGGELCSTAVRSAGRWSCLPVEGLTEGKHQLAPVAVDAAGNRTAGQPVTLVVDTVAPDRPVLRSPAPGETLRTSRPTLVGRAEPGVNVLVTAGSSAGSEQRAVLCGATAALDGSWTCTADRDLTDGEQWLTVTVTDQAGNGTSADAVRVRVAAGAVVPTPVAPSPSAVSPSPSVSPSASVPPSPVVSSTTVPVASGTATGSPSASAPVAASPGPSVAAVPEVPVRPGVLPIVVPPVSADPSGPAVPAVPNPSAAATTVSGATASPTAIPSPSPSPSPTPTSAVSASRAGAVTPGGSSPAGSAEQAGSAADSAGSAASGKGAARPLAVPPVERSQSAAAGSGEVGRHAGLAGILLVLAGIGLITRRVFARGPGARRR
ncbi:Ig-like domain-containing protein [Kitasatospora sp. NPDC048545]|uniref:Ig-like domain-containing protein n=1 Tax=Kitasatospora sp. NPDC048545 TaxID=3157208 RepID=UPI0033F2DEE7